MTDPARTLNLNAPDEDARFSRWDVARYVAGELDADTRRALEQAAETDADLAAWIADERAEVAAFRTAMPLPRFLEDHAQKTAPRPSGIAGLLHGLFGTGGGRLVLAGAACAALLVPVLKDAPAPDPVAENRTKGQAGLGFFVQTADGARLGHDGETLAPGARIQFVLKGEASGRALVVLGVDGKGAVSVYDARDIASTEKGASASADKPQVLPQSLILDDALGTERFFLVRSDDDAKTLQAKAEAAARALLSAGADLQEAARLPLDEGVTQSSFFIVKAP